MKSTKLLVFALITLSFLSCSSDDDVSTINGTWRLSYLTVNSVVNFNMDAFASNDLISDLNCFRQNFTLRASSTGSVDVSYSGDYNLYLVPGTTNEYEYNFSCDPQNVARPLTWTQNGTSIVIDLDGNSLVGEVSGDAMILVVEDGFEFQELQGNTIVQRVSDLTYVLTRQEER